MFGKWKWLAALIAFFPLLLGVILMCGYGIWGSQMVGDSPFSSQGMFGTSRFFLSFALIVASGCETAGIIWFIIVMMRHPKMDAHLKYWRVAFLVFFYPITAPFVYAALKNDPNAPPKKILGLD